MKRVKETLIFFDDGKVHTFTQHLTTFHVPLATGRFCICICICICVYIYICIRIYTYILVMLGRYFLPLSPWQQEASVLRSCSFEVVGNPLLLQYSPPLHFRPPIRQSALCCPLLRCCAFDTTFCTVAHYCGELW